MNCKIFPNINTKKYKIFWKCTEDFTIKKEDKIVNEKNTVLIADDNQEFSSTLKRYLEK